MTLEERRRPAVGAQVKRWRDERGLTLANVAERCGLNVGYLSQIENDKASPSLACLASIGDALDVPIAWFLDRRGPAATGRPRRRATVTVAREFGRIERVDGGVTRDVSIIEGVTPAGGRIGAARPCRRRASPHPARSVADVAGRPRRRGRAGRLRPLGRRRSPTTPRSSATRRARC